MQVKQLLTDDDAVSPVIGVILMVAITVILAAVIGTFVLGLGDQVQDAAPNANFAFDYGGDYTGATDTFEITHDGGQDFDANNVQIKVGSLAAVDAVGGDWGSSTSTGDTIEVGDGNTNGDVNAGDFSPGDDVRVIWNSPSGGSSQTIGESQVP